MPQRRTDQDLQLVALEAAFYRGRRIRKGAEFTLQAGDAAPRRSAPRGSARAKALKARLTGDNTQAGATLDKKTWRAVPAHTGLWNGRKA